MNQSLRIAVLDCDTPVPNVYAQRGLYSDIFADLLKDAASKTPELSGLRLEFSKYDTVRGEEPSEEDLKKLDAIIVTGAGKHWLLSVILALTDFEQAAAAYDKAPWIEVLAVLLRSKSTSECKSKVAG